ncbi:L-lysine 6-transaminase [Hoyosella subflava DQS3-9A1]|uniref:L-lysine-epsilon aminotransferase n=1 Tax=Hoyosella subflava (strain DSM 45089 / JCM 17490 / NBRC 109087 / DQS3-9A1) TaxID=443218 RepID=F6EPE8_HOYSD|nr:L-lysine 6-transaminase [Hoyosella subflava DQS3-9A1]
MPSEVHPTIARSMLADGFDIVLDLARSHGSWIVDAQTGTRYLDMFTFFASSALGMNHPGLTEDEQFRGELLLAAYNKPSNSDMYTVAMAEFVQTFARVLGDERLPHLFFIEGGANAVENALKTAFDWKSRLNEAYGRDPKLGTQVMHLQDAFHGRTGYTLSLTNTEQIKTARFPKFEWPRIANPYPGTYRSGQDRDVERLEEQALGQARAVFAENPHDIACFIAEPIQGEGGDHHLRPQFLQAMQDLCHKHDALFILDEVQTGCGMTGSAWAYQQLGLEPDVVAFGKKTHVCGIMAGGRVDEVPDNVFHVSSRINSTFGASLTDMVRARRILEIIEASHLITRAANLGAHLFGRLVEMASRHPIVTDPRGRGLMCAVTLADGGVRDEIVRELRLVEHVLLLPCGERSVRFRPSLTVTREELDAAVSALDRTLIRHH